jgi:hypothetical protein
MPMIGEPKLMIRSTRMPTSTRFFVGFVKAAEFLVFLIESPNDPDAFKRFPENRGEFIH